MTKLSICVVLVLMAHSFAQSTRPKITAIDHVDFYSTSPDANQKLYAIVLGLATAQPVESGQKQRYLVGSCEPEDDCIELLVGVWRRGIEVDVIDRRDLRACGLREGMGHEDKHHANGKFCH